MEVLIRTIALNAAGATVLAMAVALASRWIRRPAIVHALWLVVLLKLVTPPLLGLELIPRWQPEPPPVVPAAAVAVPSPSELPWPAPAHRPAATLEPAVAAARPSWQTLALVLWVGGAAALLGLATVRGNRFHRLLRTATRAPRALQWKADRIASRMGLSPGPGVRLVPARISPMLWFPVGTLQLLFPAALLRTLRVPERDALLAHELAHVRRKDHWVRYLELVVVALYWWHPVAWWARARLRAAEEQSCDDWVLRTLPEHAKAYADGLLKTVEFLAGSNRPVPAFASGVGGARKLKERLTMIMQNRTASSVSTTHKLLLGAAALTLLFVFPTWADRDSGDEERAQAEIAFMQQQLDLERRAIELERQLQDIHARQLYVERELQSVRSRVERERMEMELSTLESRGRDREADALRKDLLLLTQHQELASEQLRLEQARVDSARELEFELQQRLIEAEEYEAAGEAHAAADARAQAMELRLVIAQTEAELQQRHIDLERAAAEAQMDAAQLEIRRLENQGRDQEAEMVRRKLEEASMAHERARALARAEALHDKKMQAAKMLDMARELEQEGRHEEAEVFRHLADQFRQELEDRKLKDKDKDKNQLR